MAAIKLNDAELDALSGLGHAAFRLYVAAIRPRMDYATGTVGKRVRISWQALKEWMYVEPRSGVAAVTHNESMVRRLAKQLVKHGLLREIGDSFHIAFLCPLADTDNAAQKQADRGSTPSQGARKPNSSKDLRTFPQGAKNSRSDTHPSTGKTLKPSPPTPPAVPAGEAESEIESSAPTAPPIDNPADEKPGAKPGIASSEERRESSGAVGKGSLLAEGRPEGGFAWELHLAWPTNLTDGQRANMARIVAVLPEASRQVAIDEWRGRMQQDKLGNPFGWLADLVKRMQQPGFAPYFADKVRAAREAEQQRLARLHMRDDEFAQLVAQYGNGPMPKGVLAEMTRRKYGIASTTT